MSFLAIDIGNTRLKWAQYASPQPGAAAAGARRGVPRNDRPAGRDRVEALAAPGSMLGCVVAGDAVKRRVEEQLELWDVEPRWVVPCAHDGGVVNGYEHPLRLGADRWVALIGARARVLARGPARPALVVMVGTAVTVDALDAGGRFLGGLILPGFGLMLRALEKGTAGLKVPTGEVVDFPDQHQRCADERRRACDCRRDRAHAPQAAERTGARADAADDGRRGGQAGADHRPALRDRRLADLRRPAGVAGRAGWRCSPASAQGGSRM